MYHKSANTMQQAANASKVAVVAWNHHLLEQTNRGKEKNPSWQIGVNSNHVLQYVF